MRMHRPTLTRSLLAGSLALLCVAGLGESARAQEDGKEIKPETLVINLQHPTGVAVHDQTGHVFVASRYGIYRYFRKDDGKTHNVATEVTGYSTDIYGKGPKYEIGPLGVAFLDEKHLVVGDGSRPDPEELVRVYEIGQEPPEKPQKEDAAKHTLGPISADNEKTKSGEGNYYGVAIGAGAIFVTANGDDTKGWVAKAAIKDGKPQELKLSIATKEAVGVDAPVPATFSPDGDLVIGQMGEISKPGDSLLTTYNPKNGKLKKKWETGLSDIAGIAYSPKSGKLYATDFAWLDAAKEDDAEKQGGLYELQIDGDNVEAKKVLQLDKPTGIDFDKDGNLYIAVFGTKEEGDEYSPGKLLMIPADQL